MFKKKFPSLSSLGSDGNTAFLRAARAGHLEKVLEHLKSNIDINTSNSNGLNALHLASKDGHVNVVTELLKRGAVVDAATKKGNTALHIASLAGQEEVVKLLVANGAAVNVQSQNGFTPLYMAAQENHDNVVRFLLANGANQSLATEDGFTPLAVAMQQGHDKVVAVLLENDTRGKVRLPALHIAAKKDDCKAASLLLQNDHNPDVTSKSGFTPLHIAAHYGNESIANLLLNRGADVNYSAKHNITPLHVAAKWGKTNMVSLLLEKGANIESKTRDGLTPLHCAARSGHEQVVDMMLERGAPISSKTKNGLAPLHMASQGDHVDAARILLYHRAPVDEVTVDYLTALHVAAHCGHVRVAKLLLDRKADPNARALNGFTPLHIACKKNRIKVVELLLKHGASIEATTESGLTPLHVASFMGCMNIVIYLLQHDASPDVPTVRGETPLHLAARANQTDIIRILLRNGAQVDARAREQQTPLHIASRLGNVDIVMLLLQHGAAVDSTTKDMYTALHIAGKEGQEEVASVLLEHGASLTATTKKGLTPLHLAAKYGNMKVAKLLLQRDAPVDAQGKNGVTPLHVASHYDHQNVALLLLDKGASPHATAKNGHTPLHIAARKNQMDIATTLLEYGAKANAESKAGFTPLHLSSQEGHTDMSTLLIEHQADTNHKAKNGLTPLHLCAQEDRVNVASILVKNGAEIDSTTKAGYTPLHVASHFGQINMVRFLLQHGADVKANTSIGYTPLHQAAQQGHTTIVNLLLENSAPPNSLTNQGQTALSIAQKLGYISVVETLKVVTESSIPTSVAPGAEEKYRVVAPETMQETFMSDSEDEGGEDTMLSDQPYRYLTVDEMKSLGDDSLPIDVTRDERVDSNRECMAPPTAVDDTISPQHAKESYTQFTATNYTPDNIDINRHPVHVGFLVSFLVDARGGAMRGCRHSGVRVIVPPRKAAMPMRVTCRYLKRDKLSHPPPLMEGEALASRILELGPVGAKFLGPVIIEVPHFGSLRGMEREIVILRSDNGETWREHTLEASEEAVHEVLNESFEGEELTALEETSSGRTTRILTTDFPQYFAVVSRIRQEVHAIGPEGGMVSSSVVPQVQAVFPQGALTKKIKVGLQAQPIAAELAAKLLGNRVAVSPIVTVEPRRRKFHKPITLTIPVPQAANKGMINQYSGDAPTLRLLCSITGGTTRAQWEDVTGSTPLTFVNDCVSFTTTVSARFWLMDCRNIGEATKMATELYKEAIHVPFMAKFVVFAKRVDVMEARLRVFCMTDDKEDKTLEHQEHFTEVAKSRDVEVLEGKPQYIEFAGNLVPVTKSGDQLQLGFRAFRENRLPFTVRVKDPHADTVGRILFMREPKVAKGEPPQQPICILNIVLPEKILPESALSEPDLLVLHKKYSFLRDGGLGRLDATYQRTDLRLSDISNLLGEDWVPLASELGVTTSDVNLVKSEYPSSVAQQAMAMLRLWLQQAGNKATGNVLEVALHKIGRDDIVQQCIFNVDEMDRAVAKVHLDQSGFESLKEELGPSRDASLRRDASLDITYDEQDMMKDSESVEELVQAEKKEPYEDRLTKPVISKDKQERDIDETKYIGEEKVVEEERKTVAQLKEIFAQDKRDRQYERQPPVSEQLPETPPVKLKKEKVSSPSVLEDISKVSSTIDDSIQVAPTVLEEVSLISKSTVEDGISTLEEDMPKKQPLPPSSVKTQADQRRESELFQGVTEELVRLETTYKVIPAAEELMSPKVSKTPPPSPAEFRDSTGATPWQQGDVLTNAEQPSPAQEWTGKPQEKDKHIHAAKAGKSPTDVSSGDMVKTFPIIVGVMEKSVPKHDTKKEGLPSTEVKPTKTSELGHELQETSDELLGKEKALLVASSMKAASEEVVRKTDTDSIADLRKLSDLSQLTRDELEKPSRGSEFVKTECIIMKQEGVVADETHTVSEKVRDTVRDDRIRLAEDTCDQTAHVVQGYKQMDITTEKSDEAASDVEVKDSRGMITTEDLKDTSHEKLLYRKVKESVPLISDETPRREITEFKESKYAVVTNDFKDISEEILGGRKVKASEPLPSDENQKKEIVDIRKVRDREVVDDLKDASAKKLVDREMPVSKQFISDEESGSGILKFKELKDADVIDNLKDTSQNKSGDVKIQESEPELLGENLETEILKDTVKAPTQEIGKDLGDIREEGIKPAMATQPSPKVREIQSDTKPIVTTPTLSRRGLGGSQRLSRDQRPPPLDVSHLMTSSEEGTDEDFDAAGYIVTEPGDEDVPKQRFQEDTIYRINSSPDILAEPQLTEASARLIPTVQVTEDIRDTLLSEISIQEREGISGKEMEQEVAQVPHVQSDISEQIQTSGQAHMQLETQPPRTTKQIPEASIPVEEVIEQPLMTFDTVTELQIPTLVPIEKDEDEIHKHRPMFRIESYDSSDQGMEDIEALIEKANRELALELERAGVKVSDGDDESPDEEEEEKKAAPIVHIPKHESGVVEEEVIRAKESDSRHEKKLRRVERRFERMASETLEKEAAAEGSSTPEVELRREAEFEQMVSQLSTEEVADCQREYSQLWDEGGLTPSEDWDSRDPDTPSGELEEDSTTASPPESTRPLTTELTDRREPRVEEPLTLHPTPSLVPKPVSREDITSHLQTSPMEPVAPGISGEVSPVSHISVHRVSVGISPSEATAALDDSKTDKVKPEGGKVIEEDVQSYSDRKKFWEQMTTGQAKTATEIAFKQRSMSQESVTPPVPKPRSSIPTPAPLISVLQESGIMKSETESDTDTTTFSDSTIRMHPPPASVSKQSTFTGSSDTSDREGSETEATDVATCQIPGVPTTAPSAVAVFTQRHSHTEQEEAGSSDSEAEYLAKCVDESLAYENTAFVGDDDGGSKPSSRVGSLDGSEEVPTISSKRALFEKSLGQIPPVAASRKVYERSVSLPTEDLIPFDHNGSVRAKKRYFEAQIKKEMVVEQLMTQLEEEASPEHKAIAKTTAKQTTDQEQIMSRQIHSDVFTHEFVEHVESQLLEDKNIVVTVKHVGKESQEEAVVETGKDVRTVTEVVRLEHGIDNIKPKTTAYVPEKYVEEPTYEKKEEKKELEVAQGTDIVAETEVSNVKDLAKGFERELFSASQERPVVPDTCVSLEVERKEMDTDISSRSEDTLSMVEDIPRGFEQQVTKPELQMDDNEERKEVRDTRSVFESKVQATVPQSTDKMTEPGTEEGAPITETRSEITDIYLPSEAEEDEMSYQLAEVLHYKTETITKPSDSLEVHVDKSEIEETEKERDIEEDIKAMESSRIEEEVIPSITVTLSGKQRTDSYSQGESEDTASESDVTPEEHPLYQPEEHIHDTVWEVPVQEQPESVAEEIVQEIPIEKQVIVEKDEDEKDESGETPVKISEEEARTIAEEIVESIEAEVAKRSDLIADTGFPPVPPPEMAESQVTDYLRQLAGKEELEPREVQLIESVLARKHREEMKKLSRTDTTTSSMEITDEDLRSSGVETDLSPLDSQGGRMQERTLSDDTQHDHVGVMLQGEEVVEKTLAEVRESLEAAQEQLIEQHKKKEEVVQKKESPSEFEFKVLTFEKTVGESIEESRYEEVSAAADYTESKKDGKIISHITDIAMMEKGELIGESKNIERVEVSVAKDGVQESRDTKEQIFEERDAKMKKSKLEDVAVMRKDESLVGEHRISASFSDEEERSLVSKIAETHTQAKDGVLQATRFAEEKECSEAISEEKLLIESKQEEEHAGSVYKMENITEAQTATVKLEEKETKIEESTEEGLLKTEFRGKTDSFSVEESKVAKSSTSKVVDKREDDTEHETYIVETTTSEQKTEEATKTERKVETKRSFKLDSGVLETTVIDQVMPTLTEGIELSHETVHLIEKEIKRTSSEESQRSLSQDESTKSPVDSSSSSSRRAESENVRVIERPDGSETTVVVLRHSRQSKPDAESSSSGERSGSATLRADRRSGAEFEAWSSSGESHYHSFEQTSESGRTSSRPCSSDVEALMAGVGTAGSSEYESALTSQELSARSASHEYHTAVSSLSSRDSMKSLDSESSGHLASIEISSEASETLVPSALELEKDMEGASGTLIMDDEDAERRELASALPSVIDDVIETHDTEMPVHGVGEELPSLQFESHTRTGTYVSDIACSSGVDTPGFDKGETSQIDDERQSPFEIISESEVLEYRDEEIGGSEDEEADIAENKRTPPTLSADESGEDERPHCMKRSHEMIFQPEPRPIITDSPLSEFATEEKLGSSVEEGSILSVSLSSTSDATGLRTVIELSRTDSERMDVSITSEQLTVSGTSEQLSLEEIDPTTLAGTQLVDSGTCTYPTSTSGRELHLSSVTITTSSVDECGVQSVCTQVTSQSHTPVPEDEEDDDDSQKEATDRESGDDFPQSNGPTQVDYVPEYDDDYDESRKRHMGHRRKESTSSFVPAVLPTMTCAPPTHVSRPLLELSPSKVDTLEGVEDKAESDKYTETGPLTLKEEHSDEKKDVDEVDRLEEESYQTEADQGFHRDLREGRVLLEDVAGIEEDPEAELDSSRPQSEVSKSDSEGHRPMSSGFSDDRPDSELAELLKQCSDGSKDLEDPIERPFSPEPADECEIKDDTPEFSSEAQASVTELEMEYSGAFSRSVEYASHVSPIREERTGIQYDEACSMIEQPSDHEDDMAEAEAAFQMTPHLHPIIPPSLPATIPEDPAAEKHELETRDRDLKESKKHQEIIMTSPASIPDITVTQHMTPLVDRGFHYPDLELEEEVAATKSTPQTPASMSSRASSETETDQGREYVLEEERDDYIDEEPELDDVQEDKRIEWRSMDEASAAEDKTVYESEVKKDVKAEPTPPTSESPESDSFEMLEKPDLTDEYVVIEEVGKEAEEHDTEGKSVQIQKARVMKKKHDPSDEELISSPPAPATRMTELKYYPEPGEDMGPFPFDSDSPPTVALTKKSVGVRTHELGGDGEEGEYDRDVEAGKKWIEMQFQGDTAAAAAVTGYGYEMEFERGPLEDIKEEEINDFDQSSSKVGSMGSYKGSIGSFGSVKESLSSTPEYDVLAGRKFFTRSGEHDDVSMSSLQEFEHLERQIAMEAARKRSHGSQDSLNGNNKRYGRSGQGDDVSLSSLKEFEGLETACIEAAKIETRAKEEEALLSEIEEGHESQVSESESCETMSVGGGRGVLGEGGESVDSDDYEKRMFEIDEIIRQAQSNVERFVDPKDDVTESVGRGDSLEEVARVPELDLDQPLYLFPGKMTSGWCEAGDDVMRTSSDSLEMKDKSSALHASTDSLDLKTVADVMTASADSIEFQMQLSGRGDIMTDSMEMQADSAMMATSTDSLDLGGGAATGVTAMTDSIEEEEEISMLGQAEGQGSGSGGHDQSSSSGREGDLSSSGKDDNSGEHGHVPPPRSDMMLGSTDSLEPSSSTATHATYQYETDSVMSSSFTSGGSNTMVSSTDTLDPTGTGAGGLDAIDLAAAAHSAGVWFDDGNGSGGKPFVTEVIEPSEEDEFSHTVRRTFELPPEVRKVSFRGPDAERALREYVKHFAPGEDVTETQEVDSEGNVHIKRIVQRRVVVRSEDLVDTELTGPELEEYLKHISSGEYEQASGEDVPESDYTHLMTSITGGAESFSSPPEVVTHHTYVTRHMIHPTPGAVVTTTTQQGLTTTTPNLTGDLVLGDWEQHQPISREESGMQRAEEGKETAAGSAAETVRQTTQIQTRVVDGKTVTTTTTTKSTKEQGDMQETLEKKPFDKEKSGKPE